ncbi:MAG: 3-phosphoshikimate 1-carboxyvinyltransferase [Alphaproteobacteria bacterium]|nr:3-phosphoshikimate 1-carboxyvinyltransferase [Alphaproteobacteria bacterium]
MQVAPAARGLSGRATVPGDKSISHRSLILGAMGLGRSHVRGLLDSADVRSTMACMQALGLSVRRLAADEVVLQGRGGELTPAEGALDCGNSGTTARLLCGLLAGQPFDSELTGDASLRRRPMARVTEPLTRLGAGFDGGPTLPLTVHGRRPLGGGEICTAVASAQVKSALLLAGLQASDPVTVDEPSPSRDHSERMLAAMGADLERHTGTDGRHRVRLRPGAPLRCLDLVVPGDISSAAFLLVAASIVPGSRIRLDGVGCNPTRSGVLDVLAAMGGALAEGNGRLEGGEPVADLQVEAADLRGTIVGGADVPRLIDEIPVLAVAAAFAHGETRFQDAGELRVKESDRIATTVAMLRALGADADELPDGLVVRGSGGIPLRGGRVHSHGDHRIAMAAAVAGLRCTEGVVIDGADAVAISFPTFPTLLETLRG